MTERALISVIIPVFNGARHLAEAIESVQAQDYRPIEIIVVDDGSTDDSGAVASGFTEVRLHAQPNHGAGAARNAGISMARGSFFAFLDADDLWMNDKLSRQAAALDRQPEVDVAFSHMQQFLSAELNAAEKNALYCPESPMPAPIPSTMFIRREAFARVGPFDTAVRYGEPLEWYLRAKDRGLNIVMLPDVLAHRRLHGNNLGLRQPNVQAYVPMLKAFLDRRRAAAKS